MKIVFLDAKTIGEDMDLSVFEELGEVVKYDFSTTEEVPERVQDADVLILNKVVVNEETIGNAKNLKLVCVTATGTDNLDVIIIFLMKILFRMCLFSDPERLCNQKLLFFYQINIIKYFTDRTYHLVIITHVIQHVD